MNGYELVMDFDVYRRNIEEAVAQPVKKKKNRKQVMIIAIALLVALLAQLVLVGYIFFSESEVEAAAIIEDEYEVDTDLGDLQQIEASISEMSYYAKLDYIENLNCWRGWANEEAEADADFNMQYGNMSAMINDGGCEDWHIQFISPKFDIRKDKTYTVEIVIDGNYSNDVNVPIRVQESSGEYRTISEKNICVSDLKQKNAGSSSELKYRYSFTPSEDWADVEFTVDIGNQGPTQLRINSFSIQEK